jgi:hypothetical protein
VRRPAALKRGDVIVYLFLGSVLPVAVAFLELTYQRIFLAGYQLPVVVGELGPLGFELGGKLLPLTLDFIPIHLRPLS